MFKAYGKRILDTRTRVWYWCATAAQAKARAAALNAGIVR